MTFSWYTWKQLFLEKNLNSVLYFPTMQWKRLLNTFGSACICSCCITHEPVTMETSDNLLRILVYSCEKLHIIKYL